MRSALLVLAIIGFSFPTLARANEGGELIAPIPTPWMDEAPSISEDIVPKKISLADLERLDERFVPENKDVPKSTLEKLYSDRIIDELQQYGYDLFTQSKSGNNSAPIPAGIVQENYILSAGDQLNIVLRGQLNTRSNYEIDNKGFLILDDFSPIPAAGRSLSDVTKDLENESKNHHNTQIFVSLSGIRQIGVLVVGHVHQPGRQNLTAFHSILDALNEAGGITKEGSLRNIKLVRKGQSQFIDLYQLLMASGGNNADQLLQDGDRIIVPPIGATMAVAGSVKRPAIYEIRPQEKISLHQALGLGGGALTPGQNRYMKLEYTTEGEETVEEIGAPDNRIFGDGSILMVAQSEQIRSSEVTLSGNTRQPGSHDLKKSKTLSGLISDKKVFGKNIYPLIGVIERQDKDQLTKKLIDFSPYQVLHKKHDDQLK
ncbi:MAG TPA: SLBB domain-containing protein [Alphaproteobacteria bacterium]|nr:SLBB domain-containing protein [Alphaproteobacteria bacterium]